MLLTVPSEQATLICQKVNMYFCLLVFHPLLVCIAVVAVLSTLTQTFNH